MTTRMNSLLARLIGPQDVTPRTSSKSMPGQIPPLSRESTVNNRNNRQSRTTIQTSPDRTSERDRSGSSTAERDCICQVCYENSRLLKSEMQQIFADQENAQTKRKLTQADRDNIVFRSAAFKQYFETQDSGVQDHARWLCNNIQYLKLEVKDHVQEINSLRLKATTADSTSDMLNTQLQELKIRLEATQKEAMNTVDRFQPTTDGEVSDRVKLLAAKVETLINHILRSRCKLTDDLWQVAAIDLIHPDTIAEDCQPIEVDVRTLKRFTLRNIVWHFLASNIFDKPFGGFEDDEAEVAGNMYARLFPESVCNFESESWRSLTASQLQKREVEKLKAQRLSVLFQRVVLERLGYDQNDTTLVQKISQVIVGALKFWQLTAQQRAVFAFLWSSCSDGPLTKNEKDSLYTTVEAGEEDFEQSGRIWFITRPGLTKRGGAKDYSRTIMFEDFKIYVMVVGDTRYSPQEIPHADEAVHSRVLREEVGKEQVHPVDTFPLKEATHLVAHQETRTDMRPKSETRLVIGGDDSEQQSFDEQSYEMDDGNETVFVETSDTVEKIISTMPGECNVAIADDRTTSTRREPATNMEIARASKGSHESQDNSVQLQT